MSAFSNDNLLLNSEVANKPDNSTVTVKTSPFNNTDVFHASTTEATTDDDSDAENQVIFKHLENLSYDEYDDFNPRHPKPREKAHRRGDSYFNSDIELVVNELHSGRDTGSFNLQSLAASGALDDGECGNASRLTGSDIKSKFLNKKKEQLSKPAGGEPEQDNASDSGTPTTNKHPYQLRAFAELNGDSDDEK